MDTMLCGKCEGEGFQIWREDGRMVRDACYHCGTTGHIDSDMHRCDLLTSVATKIAYAQESDCRAWMDSDPDGDGYDLGAAENMMSVHEYFESRVYDRVERIVPELVALPKEKQGVLIAWLDCPAKAYKAPRPAPEFALTVSNIAHLAMADDMRYSDRTPF